jgi:hypothetical protein
MPGEAMESGLANHTATHQATKTHSHHAGDYIRDMLRKATGGDGDVDPWNAGGNVPHAEVDTLYEAGFYTRPLFSST